VIGGLLFATVATLIFRTDRILDHSWTTFVAPDSFRGKSQWLSQAPATRTRFCVRQIRRYSLILLIVALISPYGARSARVRARASLNQESAEAAIPTVITVTPIARRWGRSWCFQAGVRLTLSTHLRAHQRYLKDWRTDIRNGGTKGAIVGEKSKRPKWTSN